MLLMYYIDEYEKQEDGKMKRIWHFSTTDKDSFKTIKYNLSDRMIRTYAKMK